MPAPKKATKKASKKATKKVTVVEEKVRPKTYNKKNYKKYHHEDKLDKYIKSVVSKGEHIVPSYSVKNNVLVHGRDQMAQIYSSGEKYTRIRHTEYLCDIISSSTAGDFKIQKFEVNPGNIKTFPWLSKIAANNYQKWRPNGIVFEFRTMSADSLNSVNTALGSVVMASNYDAIENNFRTKQQMENTEYSSSCKPSCSMLHPIECTKAQNVLAEMFINNGENLANPNYDKRFDVLANFFIATVGLQGTNVNIGELYIHFDISLIAPIQSTALATQKLAIYDFQGVDTSHLMGTSQTQNFDNLNLFFSGNTVTFPLESLNAGDKFYMFYHAQGASTTDVTPVSVILPPGFDAVAAFDNNGQASNFWCTVNPGSAANSSGSITAFQVKNNVTNAQQITLACTKLPNTIVSVDFQIIQVRDILA